MLVDENNNAPLAMLDAEDTCKIDKEEYALKVFGTKDTNHPGVAKIYSSSDKIVGGKVKLVFEQHSKFDDYYLTPKETRILFQEKGWRNILAFQYVIVKYAQSKLLS